MCPRAGLDVLEKRKTSCSYQDLKTGPFSPQPNCYTDHATPAHIIHSMVFNLSAPHAIVSLSFKALCAIFFLWFSFLYAAYKNFPPFLSSMIFGLLRAK
jgi:hypothetical protein